MRPDRRTVLLICVCIFLFVGSFCLAELVMPAAGMGVLG